MAHDVIASGARQLGLSLTPATVSALHTFADLVRSTNNAFNLVSRQDIDRLETRHILDCLAMVAFLTSADWPVAAGQERRRILDVGSGAGLPGIVIAIACPDLEVTLVERSARKHRFLQRVIAALKLANVVTKCHDVVEQGIEGEFEIITSRAVAPVAQMWEWLANHLVEGGMFIHMSFTAIGQSYEPPRLNGGFATAVPLEIPGLVEHHWLTVVRKGSPHG